MKSSYNLLDALQHYKNKEFFVRGSQYPPNYTIKFNEIVIRTNLFSYVILSESTRERSKEYLEIFKFLKDLYDEISSIEYQGFVRTNFSTDKEITVSVRKNEFETEQDQLINAISNNMYYTEKESTLFEFRENEDLKRSLFSDDYLESYAADTNVYNEIVEQLTEFVDELRERASS